ncbi:hypothetical protein AB3S75_042363 [Citrus x aurantiifolia]
MGEITESNEELPPIDDDNVLVLEPDGIIDTRWLKRGGKLIEQSLVRWKKLPSEEATWEGTSVIQLQFPFLALEDKGPLLDGGIDKQPRRSTRASNLSNRYVDFV